MLASPVYSTHRIVLAGRLNDEYFQKCLSCVRYLEKSYPLTVQVQVYQFFETQWEEFLKKIQTEKKGAFYQHKASTLVYYNEVNYIGDSEQFMAWVLNEFRYLDKSSMIIYKKKANDAIKQLIDNTPGRQYVFLDISVNGQQQKVVIELFSEFAPKTCENFRRLCMGGFTNKDGQQLSYTGSEFHRVVKGMYIQGGDLSKHGIKQNGSIYEGGEFADESFHVKHTDIGLVGMCKKKGYQHTNESQFYVTTGAPLTFLDHKYVVFGRVIQGMRILKIIDKQQSVNERPINVAKIVGAGIYTMKKEIISKKVVKK